MEDTMSHLILPLHSYSVIFIDMKKSKELTLEKCTGTGHFRIAGENASRYKQYAMRTTFKYLHPFT